MPFRAIVIGGRTGICRGPCGPLILVGMNRFVEVAICGGNLVVIRPVKLFPESNWVNMRRLTALLGLLLGWVGVLCAQNWTSADSLRLQRLLEGEGEIKLNPEALRELEQNFGQPKISEEKPWLKFDETLPMGISEKDKKAKMVLRPYTGYTPYNWDPIRGCKIDIDKPTWKENILRGLDKMLVGAAKPSGLDFMGIFTKEFWNRKIKKRRAATLEALKAYGDSITVHQKEKPHHE